MPLEAMRCSISPCLVVKNPRECLLPATVAASRSAVVSRARRPGGAGAAAGPRPAFSFSRTGFVWADLPRRGSRWSRPSSAASALRRSRSPDGRGFALVFRPGRRPNFYILSTQAVGAKGGCNIPARTWEARTWRAWTESSVPRLLAGKDMFSTERHRSTAWDLFETVRRVNGIRAFQLS